MCVLKDVRDLGTVLLDCHRTVGIKSPLRRPPPSDIVVLVREHRPEIGQQLRTTRWVLAQVRDPLLNRVVVSGDLGQHDREGLPMILAACIEAAALGVFKSDARIRSVRP